MTYTAKSQRILLFSLFLLCVLLLITNIREYFQILYYFIPLLFFILAAVFMNYRIKITNGILTFQIRVLTLLVYNKNVSPKQIRGLKFKRIGWLKRGAVVQNHKGFNFRIVNFNPDSIFDDLIEYANDYKIPISKTKDYITLEKMQ